MESTLPPLPCTDRALRILGGSQQQTRRPQSYSPLLPLPHVLRRPPPRPVLEMPLSPVLRVRLPLSHQPLPTWLGSTFLGALLLQASGWQPSLPGHPWGVLFATSLFPLPWSLHKGCFAQSLFALGGIPPRDVGASWGCGLPSSVLFICERETVGPEEPCVAESTQIQESQSDDATGTFQWPPPQTFKCSTAC